MVQLFNNGNTLLGTVAVAGGAATLRRAARLDGPERAVDPVPEHGGLHRPDHAVDGHGELPEHAADLQHLAADDQRRRTSR